MEFLLKYLTSHSHVETRLLHKKGTLYNYYIMKIKLNKKHTILHKILALSYVQTLHISSMDFLHFYK